MTNWQIHALQSVFEVTVSFSLFVLGRNELFAKFLLQDYSEFTA